MKETKNTSILFRITPSLKESLNKIAEQECRTLSGLITKILTEYINKKN